MNGEFDDLFDLVSKEEISSPEKESAEHTEDVEVTELSGTELCKTFEDLSKLHRTELSIIGIDSAVGQDLSVWIDNKRDLMDLPRNRFQGSIASELSDPECVRKIAERLQAYHMDPVQVDPRGAITQNIFRGYIDRWVPYELADSVPIFQFVDARGNLITVVPRCPVKPSYEDKYEMGITDYVMRQYPEQVAKFEKWLDENAVYIEQVRVETLASWNYMWLLKADVERLDAEVREMVERGRLDG